jgi:sialic acid synthase SpsE
MKSRIKNRVEIISEIHPQHFGSMEEICRMVLCSKIGGADFVKVQLYDSKKLFNNNDRKYVEFNFDEFKYISEYSKNIGIKLFASVFNEEKIKWCEDLDLELYKIASVSIQNKNLCNKIIKMNKRVIASLGAYKKKILPFNNRNVEYLYCVSEYPTSLEKIKMPDFNKSHFSGFSDHTVGLAAAVYAISRGAKIIEKHFSLNKSLGCETEKAHVCSMDLEDLKKLRYYADAISILN